MSLFDWPDTQLPAAKRESELVVPRYLFISGLRFVDPVSGKDVVGGRREESALYNSPYYRSVPLFRDSVAIGIGRRVSGAMPTDFAL